MGDLRHALQLGVTILAVLDFIGCAGSSHRATPPGFWDAWGDGQAEVSVYQLVQPRYGQLRQGHAIQIFVTETFSASDRVKADPGRHPDSDLLPVLKLNALKRFRTGVYDYSIMTSAFVPVQQPAEFPLKLSFSSQEWCGQVFDEVQFAGRWMSVFRHSYFDGEGTQATRTRLPTDTVTADTLPIRVRELLGSFLPPGGSRTVTYLPTLTWSRLTHKPWMLEQAQLQRSAAPAAVDILGTTYQVWEWTVKPETSPGSTWHVEAAPPHRIVQWTGTDGEQAKLQQVRRLKYWELNKEGNEAILRELGLDPQSSRWPAEMPASAQPEAP